MGNSAVITTKRAIKDGKGIGIYLHWNGGRDSVEGFIKYCELKGYRYPGGDDGYGLARLVQVIGNYFGGNCSIGIDVFDFTCNSIWTDNGVYVLDKWEIVDRRYAPYVEQNECSLNDMLKGIDECMPEPEQLGNVFFEKSIEVPIDSIKIGDTILVQSMLTGTYTEYTVMGFGNRVINGTDRTGKPFFNHYANEDGMYDTNPNNYIEKETVRKVVK